MKAGLPARNRHKKIRRKLTVGARSITSNLPKILFSTVDNLVPAKFEDELKKNSLLLRDVRPNRLTRSLILIARNPGCVVEMKSASRNYRTITCRRLIRLRQAQTRRCRSSAIRRSKEGEHEGDTQQSRNRFAPPLPRVRDRDVELRRRANCKNQQRHQTAPQR